MSGRYDIADFDLTRLKAAIKHDVKLFEKILECVKPITPEQDAKLQELKKRLARKPLKDGKRLIFTQYADTARYLHDNLNPGGKRDDIDVIFSGDKSKARVVGRFAPKVNPEYKFKAGEKELFTVVATDVLAEGLNLQDCDNIINYDLHWNPVKLIQRFGRIDRIGSDHDVVYGFNFLPETGLDRNLGLKQKLQNHGQNYVLRELRVLFAASTDEDQKAMINVLEKSFRGPITRAVNREVILLRRNGVNGEPLLKALARVYDQHNLRDWVDRRSLHATGRPVPRIVCSEALV